MFMSVIPMVSVTSLTLIVGADTFVSLMQTWHSRVGALRAHSTAPQFHHLTTGTYLVFLLMILSSTAKCDRPPEVEDPSTYVTQNDVTDASEQVLFHTQKTSFTLSSSENGGNSLLRSQFVLESTNAPLTKTNMIETSNSPSPLSNTAEFGSDKFTPQSDANVNDRTITDILSESKQTTINLESENSDFPFTTNLPPTTLRGYCTPTRKLACFVCFLLHREENQYFLCMVVINVCDSKSKSIIIFPWIYESLMWNGSKYFFPFQP